MQIDSANPARVNAQVAAPGAASARAALRAAVEPAAPAAPVAHSEAPAPPEPGMAMQAAVANINRYLHDNNKNVQFQIDGSTGKTVIQVVDTNTHEVIRQMPSEETLAIARAISRYSGMLLAERA